MNKVDFANFNEMCIVFNAVDAVRYDLCVFNIKGNNFQLIARIFFTKRKHTANTFLRVI